MTCSHQQSRCHSSTSKAPGPLAKCSSFSAPQDSSGLPKTPQGSSRHINAPHGSSGLLSPPHGSSWLLKAPQGSAALVQFSPAGHRLQRARGDDEQPRHPRSICSLGAVRAELARGAVRAMLGKAPKRGHAGDVHPVHSRARTKDSQDAHCRVSQQASGYVRSCWVQAVILTPARSRPAVGCRAAAATPYDTWPATPPSLPRSRSYGKVGRMGRLRAAKAATSTRACEGSTIAP